MSILKCNNLRVKVQEKEILQGVSLVLKRGETHVLMGPNGCGKSTLARVLAGDQNYSVTQGTVHLNNKNLLRMRVANRSKNGLFLAFQNPVAVPGVNVLNFLHSIYNEFRKSKISLDKFQETLKPVLQELNINLSFLNHSLNDNFSGGEKKKIEILQMFVLKPKVIILDEIDSGLDVDALKAVAKVVNKFKLAKTARPSILIITHYPRILKYIKPDFVHVMVQGKIVKSGKLELAQAIEKHGYKQVCT